MKRSIFSLAFRSIIVPFFGMIGIGFGLIILLIMIAAITGTGTDDVKIPNHYSLQSIRVGKSGREKFNEKFPSILKLEITGVIGADHLDTETIRQQLIESRENALKKSEVKALLLHINSPGGTVTDADGIYRAIQEYKKTYNVPVFAFVDGLCASGGMYIAAAADQIYSTDVSLIGSIGVLIPPAFNVTNLIEKIGIEVKNITAGKEKDALNPFRKWKEGEGDSIQHIVDTYYQEFISIVTENRPNVTQDYLKNTLGANILPAKEAAKAGLIDQTGQTLEETINQLAIAAGLSEASYNVVQMKRNLSFSELFDQEGYLLKGKIAHVIDWHPTIPNTLHNQFLFLWTPN